MSNDKITITIGTLERKTKENIVSTGVPVVIKNGSETWGIYMSPFVAADPEYLKKEILLLWNSKDKEKLFARLEKGNI